VGSAVRDDRDVLPGVQPEVRHHPAEHVDAVAGQHAEVVARLVGRVRRHRDLEVPGGPRRLTAPAVHREELPVRPGRRPGDKVPPNRWISGPDEQQLWTVLGPFAGAADAY
jgi:hypothetical protein